jgi:hypothetical protein
MRVPRYRVVDATVREASERHHVQAEHLAIGVEGERMWIANVLAVLTGAWHEELSADQARGYAAHIPLVNWLQWVTWCHP